MARVKPWLIVPALLAGWLVPVGLAPAARNVAPVIHDGAKFFSEDAIDKADKKIRDIYREYHKDGGGGDF
jgi:hypothetical protein